MVGRMMLSVLLVCTIIAFVQGSNEQHTRHKRSRALIVTTKLQTPFMMLSNDTEKKGNDRYYGFFADLLDMIADETDLEFEIFPVRDGKYGSIGSDGQWNGMIGELMRREADLAAAPLTRTEQRAEVVDFTYPVMSAKMTALIHKDVEANSLEDLVNNTDITFGVIEKGATEEALLSSRDPFLQLLWSRVNPDIGYLESTRQGSAQVRKGNFAFICEQPFGEYMATQPPCDLKTIKGFTITKEVRTYNLALRAHEDMKNTTEAVSAAVEKLAKDESIDQLYTKWFEGGECSGCMFSLSLSLLLFSLILSLSKQV